MARPVYLLDFAVYKPPEALKCNFEAYRRSAQQHWELYTTEKEEFTLKVFLKAGIDPEGSYLPAWLQASHVSAPQFDMDAAGKEAQMVMCGAVSEVFEKTGLRPQDIDILITNCSIYCPTPSLGSMLVNHFKMRSDIQSYHLGGMGCGNGVAAIGLVKSLLQAHPNVNALFVPAEITTYCFYPGSDTNYMVANAIFRMGGAAVLLTNRPSVRAVAKYQLCHSVRVHTGADDDSYNCMGWGPDRDGVNGVYLRKTVPEQAAKALEMCLKTIGPKIMTWRQYGEAAHHMFNRKVLGHRGRGRYVPDFTEGIQHFALHAGGYAVVKGLQKAMRLPVERVLPSFATLKDYGNTSCSTTWYVMAYMESTGQVHHAERVMQIGMGGGMKAGVNVWRALRDIKTVHGAWRHVANAPYTAADMPRSIEDAPRQEGEQQRQKTRRGDVVGAVAAMLNGKVSDADLH